MAEKGRRGRAPAPSDIIFTLKNQITSATGHQTAHSFVVHAGSHFAASTSRLNPGWLAIRQNLIETGRLQLEPSSGHYRLTDDAWFTTAGAAASIVAGRQVNGLKDWRGPNGETPARSTRLGVKSFASRRKHLAKRLRDTVQTFDGINTPDAVSWRKHLNTLAERLAMGQSPSGR